MVLEIFVGASGAVTGIVTLLAIIISLGLIGAPLELALLVMIPLAVVIFSAVLPGYLVLIGVASALIIGFAILKIWRH